MFANRPHVRYEFINKKKLVEKFDENRGKLYLWPSVSQRVCRLFRAVRTHQLEVYQHDFEIAV